MTFKYVTDEEMDRLKELGEKYAKQDCLTDEEWAFVNDAASRLLDSIEEGV